MHIPVDANLGTGRRCHIVSPELFGPDDEGFSRPRGSEFDVASVRESSARLASGSCPRGAIAVVDES